MLECWAKTSTTLTINHWDGAAWSRNSSHPVISEDLNSVFCVNSNDCWAVGNSYQNKSLFLHWDGASWSHILPASATLVENLQGVYCTSAQNCWAVGDNSTIAHWDGSNWTKVDPGNSMPIASLYDIELIEPNNVSASAKNWRQE